MALARRKNKDSYFGRLTRLKKLFWLYFLLLIFEGALRKWVVPSLSAPLLIIRDPVSIMIIWEAYRSHKWPTRWSAVLSLLTVLLGALFVAQIVAANNPFVVGLYGLRSYLLPFPVMFIMGESLDAEDLRKLGVFALVILLPMTLVEVGQYVSGPGSFLNVGAYEEGTQIGYIGGHVRASGTFSFVAGAQELAGLAAAFIVLGVIKPGFAKQKLLWASAFALILSIPMMGSRTIVVQLAAMIGCMGLGATMGVSQFVKVLRIILPLAIIIFFASLLPVFSDAMQSMTERFSGATTTEGNGSVQETLYMRTLDPAVRAVERAASTNNWLGIGMGKGAAAISALLNGEAEAVAGENEFSRELVEMGPIAGILFGVFKVFLAITVFGAAFSAARDGEPLALLLIPMVVETLFFSIPEQPTLQGFMVIGVAFCIAAARVPAQAVEPTLPLAMQWQRAAYARRVRNN